MVKIKRKDLSPFNSSCMCDACDKDVSVFIELEFDHCLHTICEDCAKELSNSLKVITNKK